jgi:hypothetical protein
MPTIRFIGTQGVPLAGAFIYPGETREVSELQLTAAEAAHPGWFEIVGQAAATVKSAPATQPDEEVNDASNIESAEQPTTSRRAGAKRRTQ